MVNGFVFVDTNVWVARIIEDHVFHERALTKLTQLVEQEEVLCLSGQIIRELISVCTLLTHGIGRLITFNPDDFKRFTEIEMVVP